MWTASSAFMIGCPRRSAPPSRLHYADLLGALHGNVDFAAHRRTGIRKFQLIGRQRSYQPLLLYAQLIGLQVVRRSVTRMMATEVPAFLLFSGISLAQVQTSPFFTVNSMPGPWLT
jgi:hypothetical protein